MSQPENAIEAIALRKVYRRAGGAVVALDRFDLAIPRGSFFGLLGPNGAGKSTFINILAGLVNKTSGSATIWGHELVRETRGARLAIGVVPQELVLDPYFTAREALEAQAGYFGLRKRERERRNRQQRVAHLIGVERIAGHLRVHLVIGNGATPGIGEADAIGAGSDFRRG